MARHNLRRRALPCVKLIVNKYVYTLCFRFIFSVWKFDFLDVSKNEGNDQESIQLPHTSHPRHQRERNTNIKQLHHNENVASGKLKGQFLSHKMAKRLSKTKDISNTYTQR